MQRKYFKLIKDTKKTQSLKTRQEIARLNDALPKGGKYTAASLSSCSTEEARRYLNYTLAKKLSALPLGIIDLLDRKVLMLAVSRIDNEITKALKFAADTEVKLVEAKAEIIQEAIFKAYNSDGQILQKSVYELKELDKVANHQPASPQVSFRSQAGGAGEFLVSLVDYALSNKASDIHILPVFHGSKIRIRIDGALLEHDGIVCSHTLHKQLLSRIKVLSDLDTTNNKTPQDGSFTISAANRRAFIRVSIMPTVHGEKAVLRLHGSGGLITLDNIGLDPQITSFLEKFIESREGALIFAGPTGSGKTTTMYAVMERLRRENLSLVTIEDPVELQLEGISQTSINEKTGLDYEACLKAVLRQDPDVILLGEIRDPGSARIAYQAAITGHLILSTVHARSLGEVFLRLKSLGLDSLTIAQATSLIMTGRLIPKLCKHCKVMDLQASNFLGSTIYKPVGCTNCDYAGYKDRVLASEALLLSPPIKKLLANGVFDFTELIQECTAKNYVSMQSSFEKLLTTEKISVEQIKRFYTNDT